jgi:hydroxyacylglutathione hydrolase
MIQQLSVGPIGVNVYIVEKANCPLVVFDPGADWQQLLNLIKSAMNRSTATELLLVCTHGHLDHTGALPDLLPALKSEGIQTKLCVHRADSPYFGKESVATNEKLFASIQASGFFKSFMQEIPAPDILLEHDSILPGTDIRTLHTPGHSPGSCCFLVENNTVLISGDTLFRDGRGRTDGFDADEDSLLRSIRARLCVLPDTMRVLPGHGPETSIRKEKHYYL